MPWLAGKGRSAHQPLMASLIAHSGPVAGELTSAPEPMLNSIGLSDLEMCALDATSTANHAGVAPLAVDQIEHALKAAWPGGCLVEAVSVTGSTNDDLVVRARMRQPARCVLRAADFQTAGRGRRQRVWCAAPGDALLFSVAVPVAAVPAAVPAVTLACGVALAECLEAHGAVVQLKWPNDVRADGGKLAGILSELVADRESRYTLVVGVGINLRLDDVARRAIEQPAVALDKLLDASVERRREPLIGRFGGVIMATVAQFVREGFDPFCARYNRLLDRRGEIVDVTDGGRGLISGRLIEVDRRGRLCIESGDVIHRISAGDVLVRR